MTTTAETTPRLPINQSTLVTDILGHSGIFEAHDITSDALPGAVAEINADAFHSAVQAIITDGKIPYISVELGEYVAPDVRLAITKQWLTRDPDLLAGYESALRRQGATYMASLMSARRKVLVDYPKVPSKVIVEDAPRTIVTHAEFDLAEYKAFNLVGTFDSRLDGYAQIASDVIVRDVSHAMQLRQQLNNNRKARLVIPRGKLHAGIVHPLRHLARIFDQPTTDVTQTKNLLGLPVALVSSRSFWEHILNEYKIFGDYPLTPKVIKDKDLMQAFYDSLSMDLVKPTTFVGQRFIRLAEEIFALPPEEVGSYPIDTE